MHDNPHASGGRALHFAGILGQIISAAIGAIILLFLTNLCLAKNQKA